MFFEQLRDKFPQFQQEPKARTEDFSLKVIVARYLTKHADEIGRDSRVRLCRRTPVIKHARCDLPTAERAKLSRDFLMPATQGLGEDRTQYSTRSFVTLLFSVSCEGLHLRIATLKEYRDNVRKSTSQMRESSKGKASPRRNPELRARIKKLKNALGGITQAQLAPLVGAKRQTTVSAWESGVMPEPGMLVELALLALKKNLRSDALWFLKQAGITPGQLKQFFPEIRGLDRKLADAGGGYAIPVRPRDYFLGDSGAADQKMREIVVPAEIIDDPTNASCLVIDKTIGGFAFPTGDIVVIDESQKIPRSCWGEAVLIAQKQYQGDAELMMGSLDIVPFVPGEYERWAVTLSRLTGGPILSDDLVADEKGRLVARFMSIDYWNLEAIPKPDPARYESSDVQMKAIAREKYESGRGSGQPWRIIGRVVGWFREKRK